MPETAIYEYRKLLALVGDIRNSENGSVVDTISFAGCPNEPPDCQLRACILPLYAGHHFASFFLGKVVGHGILGSFLCRVIDLEFHA